MKLVFEPGLLNNVTHKRVELGSSRWVRSTDLRQLLLWWLNSPWAPGHICGVSTMLVVVVVLLFLGSRAGTHQIRDQSRALEDRNDSNNSLEVHTPNSFIHLFYNSPDMDIVDMHSVIVTPSDSVLREKTMEASYLVGSFPCQFNFISVFDIPVWDEFWEQATFRHLCLFRQAAHSIYPLSPHQVMVGTLESRIRHISTVPTPSNGGNPGIKVSSNSPLSVSADRCEK